MRTLPLGFRIVLLVLPLALVPLGIVGGVAYSYLDAALRGDLEAAQLRVLNDAVGQVTRSVQEAERVTAVLSASPELRDFLAVRGPAPAAVRRAIEVSLELSGWIGRIRLLRADGSEILSVGHGGRTPAFRASPFGLPPEIGHLPAAGLHVLDRAGGTLLAAVARAVPVDGNRHAWVVADIDTTDLLRAWTQLSGVEASALLDGRGQLLTSAPPGFAELWRRLGSVQLTMVTASRVEGASDTPAGFDLYAAPAGRFATAGDPAPRPVFLVHLVQPGQIVEQVGELRRTAAWLSAAAVAFGLIGAGLIARTVVHPLSSLLDMSRRIGRGDFDVAVATSRDDEIGQLVRAFNAMAASLADYEDKLVRAETFAALGRVASTVAHEVRNPLNAMRGCVEFLRLKRPGDDIVQHYAGIIAEEIGALDDFVHDFLRVARLERPTLEPLRLGPTVSGRLDAHRAAAEAQGIAVTHALDAACPAVMADAKQLEIVLDNLLNNAVEAMPDGGALHVSCRPDRDGVVLSVTDTGTGIPAAVASTLFTPFVSTKPDGTGIGLAICRRIIEAHGAAISFRTTEGQGTSFDVRFSPAAPQAPDGFSTT